MRHSSHESGLLSRPPRDSRFLLSPRARTDLDGVWDYTESRWGREQAERYIRQIWQDIGAIAVQPMIGRDISEVRAGYRKYRSGSYFLFYRVTDLGIDVVRILHERMDFERHLS